MTWSAWITDTTTGLLVAPVDLPSFSWSVSVSDSSLATTKSKGVGADEATGLSLPWGAIPASTASERNSMLACDRRGIALMWTTANDPDDAGTPIVAGAIGNRRDSETDTSFSLSSMMTMLGDRYCVREGVYGTAADSTSDDVISFKGLSLRGIASEVGWLCTSCKPGGQLPVDWTYRGEQGSHERTYKAFDVQNLRCADILAKISNVAGGPDMQFRPYLTDGRVRFQFLAGSDGDVYLGQDTVHRLSWHPYGGDIEKLTVDHLGPSMRVYASGSGTDKAQKCHLSEDLTLVDRGNDPWPLREMTYSDSDTDDAGLLKSHADGVLKANDGPLIQIKCELHADDADANGTPLHPLGTFWPGEVVELAIDGYPTLPDALYRCRLMQMSGDHTDKVSLTFDAMRDPIDSL